MKSISFIDSTERDGSQRYYENDFMSTYTNIISGFQKPEKHNNISRN